MQKAVNRLRPNAPDVVGQIVDGEAVVVNLAAYVTYRFNATGAMIWSLLEKGIGVEQIIRTLCLQCEGAKQASSRTADDVRAFVDQLLRERIVVAADVEATEESSVLAGQAPPYSPPRLSIYRMSVHTCLRPDTPAVAAEVIDGEAIIINVNSGVYYSLDGAGSVIWTMIEAGYRNQQIIEKVAALYEQPEDRVRQDVEHLADQMLQERIVWVTCEPPTPAPLPNFEPPAEVYRAPELNVYSDMEDLLALDPPLPAVQDVAPPPDRHLGNVDWRTPA